MQGAEFQISNGQIHQVLLGHGDRSLIVEDERERWLPWGRSPDEPGSWPLGGEVRWEDIYRPAWSCWRPKRVLIRPDRWLSDTGRWCDLRLGFAILAVVLTKAETYPVYVVSLGHGAPKLVPRMPNRQAQADARLADMSRALDVEQRMRTLDREARAVVSTLVQAPIPIEPALPFDWCSAVPQSEAFRHWVQAGERITDLILGLTVYRQSRYRFVIMSGLYGLEGGPFWTFHLPKRYGKDPGHAALALRDELNGRSRERSTNACLPVRPQR